MHTHEPCIMIRYPPHTGLGCSCGMVSWDGGKTWVAEGVGPYGKPMDAPDIFDFAFVLTIIGGLGWIIFMVVSLIVGGA